MLEVISSDDARIKLSEILRRVGVGESFTITHHGKPVADVTPSRTNNHVKARSAISNILAAKKHIVSDDDLAELRALGCK